MTSPISSNSTQVSLDRCGPRISRRQITAVCLSGLVGCLDRGTGETPTPQPENLLRRGATQRGDLAVSSPAFANGQPIPAKYGRARENVNPPLLITGIPGETASLVLVIDDPDAVGPAGQVWLHWLVWDIPPAHTEIPENWDPRDATVGENDFGNHQYDGPDPPDTTHTYRIKVYALGRPLGLAEPTGDTEVAAAMADRIVAQTQHTGTYPPV